jgi:hypothetical protein
MQQRGPSAYTVFDLEGRDMEGMPLGNCHLGDYDSLQEARAQVESEGLTCWEIWLGDRIVAQSDPEGASSL